MLDVKLYSKPDQKWCKKTRDYLEEKNVDYLEFNIEEGKRLKAEMMRKSGQKSVPVIDINGIIIIGFDKKAIDEVIENARSHEVMNHGSKNG